MIGHAKPSRGLVTDSRAVTEVLRSLAANVQVDTPTPTTCQECGDDDAECSGQLT